MLTYLITKNYTISLLKYQGNIRYKSGGHLFRRITWSENGLSKTKSIPEEDINWIKELTGNYRQFQKKRRQIKELEGALKVLLSEHACGVIKKSRQLRDYLCQK